MTDSERKQPFTFLDPRQERIHKRLLEIGEVPAGFFKDACEMWEEKPPKRARINLIAHCMREVMGTVIDLLLPIGFEVSKEGKKQGAHKEKVKAILEEYDIDRDSEIATLWLRTANDQDEIAIYRFVHRNNLGFPMHQSDSFKELWESIQSILDVVLNKMEGKYVGFFEILDGLIALKKVSSTDVKKLKEKVPNSPVTYNHFFEHLSNPDWLTLLKDGGFFKSPAQAIEHADGGISYPFWSQSIYLKRMAAVPEKQQEILEICLAVKTNNDRVRNDLLDIALLLPSEMSVQIVEAIDEIDYFLSPRSYGKIVNYLAINKKIAEATAFARRVLTFKEDTRPKRKYGGYEVPYDPVSVIREHSYEEILEEDYPLFVDAAGIEAVKVLLDQMENYINISDEDKKKDSSDNYSYIWRSAIEDHPENHKYGIHNSLVTAIRDACERFLHNHPDQMDILLQELESRDRILFKRLEWYLLRLFSNGSEEKIRELLMDKQEFGDVQRLTHEYYLLAETHGKLLTKKERRTITSWIKDGGELEEEELKAICKFRGIEPTEEVAFKHKQFWQLYHIAPFKEIDPEWKKVFDELVAITEEPVHPSLRSWSNGSSSGFQSSVSEQQFKEKTPEEIVNVLKEFEPEEPDNPGGVSREGTSRALATQISEEPSKWSKSVTSFSDLDPTFTRSVFSGYRDALRQSKGDAFDWEPLLKLGIEILKKPIEIQDRKLSGFFGDDLDLNWCRHTLAELMHEGLKDSSRKIPIKFRKKVWEIIEQLANDPNPTESEAAELLKGNEDPLTAAINSTRGDGIAAAIQYGIWLKSSVSEGEQKEWSFEKDIPELKKVIEEHLDIAKDPFVGVRAIIGERLGAIAWMDKQWVTDQVEIIFPDSTAQQKYFDAAWETYLVFNNAYNELLPIISKQYERAIKEIGQHSDNKHHLENPEQMLAQHLVMFYTRGRIPLEKGLLKDFYDTAPVELRGAVIDFIGRQAKDKIMTEDVRTRLVTLAERRMVTIKEGKNSEKEIQEFQNFSWWIYSEKFDDKWSLNLLLEALKLGCDIEGDHLVVERYKNLAPKFPLEVITNLELMVENDKKGWGVPTWGDELSEVIQIVLNGKNNGAVTKAKEFTQRLVAKGHAQYKKLLTKK